MAREIKHFEDELTDYLISEGDYDSDYAYALAEGLVTLVFNAGAEALDLNRRKRSELKQRLVTQLRFLAVGAANVHKREAHA